MVDQEYPEQEGFTVHPSGEQGGDLPEPADEFSLVEIASVLLRERGLILRVTLLFTTISLVIALLRPTLYTSFASFVPESSSGNGASGALALAQQFGVSLGSMGGEERSPQFYAGLVTSREIVRQAVTRRYALVPTEEGPEETDLITYYEIEEETEAAGIERAMESLSDDLFVSSDRDTGVVSFSVTTKDPQLSMGVASFILERVNDFDLTIRRSQATAEKLFSGERLAQLTTELEEAEDSLTNFLLENRLYNSAPLLMAQYERIQRQLRMREGLASAVAESFETARIEEVRNTPAITLIESPRVPGLRDPKRRILIVLVGIAIGGIMGVFVAFLWGHPEGEGMKDDAGLAELSALWSEALRRPFKRSAG